VSWLSGVFFAQAPGTTGDAPEGPGVLDNELLDQWRIPFGDWSEQIVFWTDNHMQRTLDVIEWPFKRLIDWLVKDFLINVSWLWVVLVLMAIAILVRNIKVGIFVGVALFVCGILGGEYWIETARTIGFIVVAVLLCVIIGIPTGVLCGRFDGVWKGVRPVLDAMQVVHSFVYMLPFVFFWGIGEVSATMVTMVFALPPLIRLTNLGIRQVPADVVEASRAYGATEMRVLFDVQFPLARPAIMTGVNQTLLLSISMLGIAAIMGAGGLGQLLFRAITNQDVARAASAGLAFFLVAVVLDRISQREASDTGNLLRRIRMAWANRRTPEVLIPSAESAAERAPTEVDPGKFAPISRKERLFMSFAFVGAAIAILSVFLPWTPNAGKMSAFGRLSDLSLKRLSGGPNPAEWRSKFGSLSAEGQLDGMDFIGISASGGSWFGISVLVLGVFMVVSVALSYFIPGRPPRWLAVDAFLIAAVSAASLAAAHLLANKYTLNVRINDEFLGPSDPGLGIGVILALAGGLIAVGAGIGWLRAARYTPYYPLRTTVTWTRLIGVIIAVGILLGAMFASWSVDKRPETVIDEERIAQEEERQARIEELRDRPDASAADATEITAVKRIERVDSGITSDGPQLGLWTWIAGLIALGMSFPAFNLYSYNERRLWLWSALTAGFGAAAAFIAFSWIATHVRSGDFNFTTGVGAFFALGGGLLIVASVLPALRKIRRIRIYDDLPNPASSDTV